MSISRRTWNTIRKSTVEYRVHAANRAFESLWFVFLSPNRPFLFIISFINFNYIHIYRHIYYIYALKLLTIESTRPNDKSILTYWSKPIMRERKPKYTIDFIYKLKFFLSYNFIIIIKYKD